MEVLSQVQNVAVAHAFTIGIGLLVAVVIAAVAWYWMSSGSKKDTVLENQARVNTAELDAIPTSAQAPEPHSQVADNEDDHYTMPNEE